MFWKESLKLSRDWGEKKVFRAATLAVLVSFFCEFQPLVTGPPEPKLTSLQREEKCCNEPRIQWLSAKHKPRDTETRAANMCTPVFPPADWSHLLKCFSWNYRQHSSPCDRSLITWNALPAKHFAQPWCSNYSNMRRVEGRKHLFTTTVRWNTTKFCVFFGGWGGKI